MNIDISHTKDSKSRRYVLVDKNEQFDISKISKIPINPGETYFIDKKTNALIIKKEPDLKTLFTKTKEDLAETLSEILEISKNNFKSELEFELNNNVMNDFEKFVDEFKFLNYRGEITSLEGLTGDIGDVFCFKESADSLNISFVILFIEKNKFEKLCTESFVQKYLTNYISNSIFESYKVEMNSKLDSLLLDISTQLSNQFVSKEKINELQQQLDEAHTKLDELKSLINN